MISAEVRAVCFDAFGTLVEIVDKRQPFRKLVRNHRDLSRSEKILTNPVDLREAARLLSIQTSEAEIKNLETDLIAECASIRLRSGIENTWSAIRHSGKKLAICSNLAQPYGTPLQSALPDQPDATILSYEAGYIKPNPEIFWLVCNRLGLRPAEVLFVGDTLSADIEGPRRIGMPAMFISEFEANLTRILGGNPGS
jgi:HAD superfamily hydrolase (TIGR01509 family)